MKFLINHHIMFFTFASISFTFASQVSNNLSCYQCSRVTDVPCDPHELLPCPAISDRCVTQVSKNDESGFAIKRECGLGPCVFDDDMVNKGLGLSKCDRSRKEYFCISCCKESGCNSGNSHYHTSPWLLLIVVLYVFNKKR